MNARSLDEQRMRHQEDQDLYARSDSQPQPPRSTQIGEASVEPTVLVFRDQHREDVQNYAIVGTTLWSFSSPRRKVPLAELDLPATVKANEERGVDFKVPVDGPGQ